MWWRRIMVGFLMVVLLASSAGAQTTDDGLIVPGMRIGRYPLDASIDDITRLAGAPPSRQRTFSERGAFMLITGTTGPFTMTVWTLEEGDLSASHRTENRIETLQVFFVRGARLGAFRTEQGIGLRSKRADVELAYGQPTWEHRYGLDTTDKPCAPSSSGCRTYAFTAYNSIGIAFWYQETGLVGGIFIFRPGDAPSNHCRC